MVVAPDGIVLGNVESPKPTAMPSTRPRGMSSDTVSSGNVESPKPTAMPSTRPRGMSSDTVSSGNVESPKPTAMPSTRPRGMSSDTVSSTGSMLTGPHDFGIDIEAILDPMGDARANGRDRIQEVADEHTQKQVLQAQASFREAQVQETVSHYYRVTKRPAHVIEPDAVFLKWWDVIVSIGLIFTAVVTPPEVSFRPADTTFPTSLAECDALFFLNRLVDMVFITDMVLQFFIAYSEPISQGGKIVRDSNAIMRHYVRNWFWVDAVSVVPYDYVSHLAAESGTNGRHLKALRLVRLLRLVKLVRIVRGSRILERWETSMAVPYATVSLVKLVSALVIAAHWMACLWGLVAQIGEQEGWYTWADHVRESKIGFSGDTPLQLYAASLYWAIYTLSTVGYGDVVAQNTVEFVVCTFCMLVGAIVWAYVVGAACSLAASGNVHTMAFRNTMDELNFMMADRNITSPMRRRIRMFFHHSKEIQRLWSYNTLMGKMSHHLQGEVAEAMNREWLEKVWYFQKYEVSRDFIVAICKCFKPHLYAPQELLDSPFTLFVVRSGLAARSGRPMVASSVWGEDFILENKMLVDTTVAIALTYVQVYLLPDHDLFALYPRFPDEAAMMKKAARWIAVRIKIQMLCKEVMRRVHERNGEKSDDATPTSMAQVGMLAGLSTGNSTGPRVSFKPRRRSSPERLAAAAAEETKEDGDLPKVASSVSLASLASSRDRDTSASPTPSSSGNHSSNESSRQSSGAAAGREASTSPGPRGTVPGGRARGKTVGFSPGDSRNHATDKTIAKMYHRQSMHVASSHEDASPSSGRHFDAPEHHLHHLSPHMQILAAVEKLSLKVDALTSDVSRMQEQQNELATVGGGWA